MLWIILILCGLFLLTLPTIERMLAEGRRNSSLIVLPNGELAYEAEDGTPIPVSRVHPQKT